MDEGPVGASVFPVYAKAAFSGQSYRIFVMRNKDLTSLHSMVACAVGYVKSLAAYFIENTPLSLYNGAVGDENTFFIRL